jgi:hypothetical protein
MLYVDGSYGSYTTLTGGIAIFKEPGNVQADKVPGNTFFDVLNGPVCALGTYYWEVKYSTGGGWMPETGDDQTEGKTIYVVEPTS